jgi:hypothetical protein
MTPYCKSIGCSHPVETGSDFCGICLNKDGELEHSTKHPNSYKSVGDMTEVDAFGVNHLFQIYDPSGCLQHAISKLLMTGTYRITAPRDIREARDALTRWLQLNQEKPNT